MIFTSVTFFVFFAAVLIGVALTRGDRARQYLLLIASYVFYGAWNPAYLLLIAGCSVWTWGFGLAMSRAKTRSARLACLWASLGLSIGSLGYFKYAGFFVENTARLFGLPDVEPLNIILPVGISFFTFQAMSYTIDLYRGNIAPCASLRRFLLFVAFFPQLVAGPIVRAREFLPQLERRIVLTRRNFIIGAQIFLGGFLQKVLIANNLAPFVDALFNQPDMYTSGTLWLGLVSYSVQIFCDFSGYSLMAIGCARILGFTLPENFRMPYLSRSIAEFWRRWHMTLSFWMRDYLYISLGGNRAGRGRTYINLAATMLFTGLWHGASWNFVAWGALHGAGLICHRLWSRRFSSGSRGIVWQCTGWAATVLFVILLWIPFRAPDFDTAQTYLAGLFGGGGTVAWLHPSVVLILCITALWHAVWILETARGRHLFPVASPARTGPAIAIGAALMAIALFAPLGSSPFIYFQF